MAAYRQPIRKQPPFTLQPTILYEEYSTTRLTNEFDDAGNRVTRKYEVPFCPDQSDKERVVRTIHEFLYACDDARLHVAIADRYTKLTEVLGGDLRVTWNDILNGIDAADRTVANFPAHIRLLTSKILPNDSYTLLDDYLRTAKKPYSMDCYTVSGRLTLLNALSAYLPGSNGAVLFPDAVSRKRAFFRLMLPEWQLAFNGSGHTLDDAAYSYDQLVEYMDQQRIFHNARSEARQREMRQQTRTAPYNSYGGGYGYQGRPQPWFNRGPPPQYPPGGGGGGRFYRSPPGRFGSPRQVYTPGRGNQNFQGGRGRGTFQGSARGGRMRSPYELRSRAPARGGRGRGRVPAQRQLQFHADASARQDQYYQDQASAPSDQFATDSSYDQYYDQSDHYYDYSMEAESATTSVPQHYQGQESVAASVSHDQYEDMYYAEPEDYAPDDFLQDY